MKCPKCEYLGFEASDRCRNCGYDFSLYHQAHTAVRTPPAPRDAGARPSATPQPATRAAQKLPLFGQPGLPDDEPLITLPRTPRAPLAVRRTTRPRSSARGGRTLPMPALEFAPSDAPARSAAVARARLASLAAPAAGAASGSRRLAAAALDHALLAGVDVIVVHLTLRMAGLTTADWALVPLGPMAAFLGLLKVAYFGVFTAQGGQTIGKMALGLRVVADDGRAPEPARVLQRTVLGLLSVMTLGLTFVPAILGADGRALHDRLAGTRVVDAPAA